MMKKLLLCVLLCACSNVKEGNNAQIPIGYQTPDASSLIKLEDTANSGTKKQKSDVFEPKDAVNPPETTQNDAKSDVLDKKDAKASKMDTISSDIAENDAKTDTKPLKPSCFDPDGDGFGPNCDKGVDCDNKNPNFAVVCPDCTKKNYAGCACTGVAANCYTGDAQG
jgi:hypothetical protein